MVCVWDVQLNEFREPKVVLLFVWLWEILLFWFFGFDCEERRNLQNRGR